MNRIGHWFRMNSPTILTWAGALFTIGTGVTAAIGTCKAADRITDAEFKEKRSLSKMEMIKIGAPSYLPAIGCAVGSIACSFGSNGLNQKNQAAMVAAYTALDSIHREYSNRVKEKYGEEADRELRKDIIAERIKKDNPPWTEDEKITFYEEHYGKFFDRTKEEVLEAEYHFNRNYALRGYANLNEFFEFLGLPKTPEGEILGWSFEAGWCFYGYQWIDFEHRRIVSDDGTICYEIHMPFPPTADFMNVYD